MAISLVQKKGAQTAVSSASLAVVLDAPPTAGNLLVACCNSDATVATPAGFTLAVSSISGQGLYIFYRVVQGGDSATVTFTPSVTDSVAAGVIEYSGLTATPLDKTASGSAPGGSSSVGTGSTGTTAQAEELLIVCAGPHAGATGFSLSSWTNGLTNQVAQGNGLGVAGTTNVGCFIGDLVVGSTGTYTSTASYSPTGDAGAAIATFKGVGGAVLPLAADGLASSSGSAAVALLLSLAANGVASSSGTTDFTVRRTLAADGVAASTGTAVLGLTAALAAAGLASSSGAAAMIVGLALVADGRAASAGTAALVMAYALAAMGKASSSGTATFPLTYQPGPNKGVVGASPGRNQGTIP